MPEVGDVYSVVPVSARAGADLLARDDDSATPGGGADCGEKWPPVRVVADPRLLFGGVLDGAEPGETSRMTSATPKPGLPANGYPS